jgi:hypothetical protein
MKMLSTQSSSTVGSFACSVLLGVVFRASQTPETPDLHDRAPMVGNMVVGSHSNLRVLALWVVLFHLPDPPTARKG